MEFLNNMWTAIRTGIYNVLVLLIDLIKDAWPVVVGLLGVGLIVMIVFAFLDDSY